MNEFAHLGLRTRRKGAHELLVELQEGEGGPRTGRGAPVDAVIYMFAFELHDRLSNEDEMAALFTETVTLVDREEHQASLERYLDRAQTWASHSFGEPDLRGPATDPGNWKPRSH
ncbi:hypothetical protein [Agromyces kandeliae]|uniref:Uncharacterized protein n=1 Tax=Agromyces kandeliae TaxID=2666141 RepID=A0A6L5QWY2_9MICO|nr:hypothetical protein [Agromyces kandeliae]MRX42123.1 hypothetical protein [Agromyces kandeliae]